MNLLGIIFKNKKKGQKNGPFLTISSRIEKNIDPYSGEPVVYKVFKGRRNSNSITAKVPIIIKQQCETLMIKRDLTTNDQEFLHDNYWVRVSYKGIEHAYKGTDDIWTYSAREIEELPLIHDWIYSILGKTKPKIVAPIETHEIREEEKTIFCEGSSDKLRIKMSFKSRGFILFYNLQIEGRWSDRATYNTRNLKAEFPHYYEDVKNEIIEWGCKIFEQRKTDKVDYTTSHNNAQSANAS